MTQYPQPRQSKKTFLQVICFSGINSACGKYSGRKHPPQLIEIIDVSPERVVFYAAGGCYFFIHAEYIPLLGRNLFAEIFFEADFAGKLDLNSSLLNDRLEEIYMNARKEEIMRFVESNKERWIRINEAEL